MTVITYIQYLRGYESVLFRVVVKMGSHIEFSVPSVLLVTRLHLYYN